MSLLYVFVLLHFTKLNGIYKEMNRKWNNYRKDRNSIKRVKVNKK